MTYRDQVIADGATHYWRLDEMTGTVAKDIINGATGTITGGVTLGQPGALTDGNPAMTFNGTTGKIETVAPVTLPSTVTIEAWINVADLTTAKTIVSSRFVTGGLQFLVSAEQLTCYVEGGVPAQQGTSAAIVIGRWQHVVMVHDATTITYYANGVFDSSSSQTRGAQAPTVLGIGDNPGGSNLWHGSLDDVAIYPVALTAAQVLAHYQAARALPQLVTLDQVKRRLRITSTADDVDLQDLTDQAVAKIVNWCSTTPRAKAIADAWDGITVPPVVVAAILVQAGEFYRFRGDDLDAPPRQDPEELPVLVRELLRGYHDPGIA